MKSTPLVLAALVFSLGILVSSLPGDAYAQSRGGRVYNPKRLRTRAERPARGRTVSDPRRATTPPQRQPARRRALIPNPEPQKKGGSGYLKRGQRYYAIPERIRVGGNPKRRVERVTIPHPNKKER